MRGLRWVAFAWPGLPELWWRGAWSGLALACAFALLTALAISANLVWDELLGPDRTGIVWTGFVSGWLALLFVSLRTSPRRGDDSPTGPDDLFPAAHAEYLRGNWLEAELLARQLLAAVPSDVEAALLLAAALRHTNRFDEARETLDGLALWDRAAAWKMEVDDQYQRLTEKQNRLNETEKPTRQPPPEAGEDQTERKMHQDDQMTISLPDWRHAA